MKKSLQFLSIWVLAFALLGFATTSFAQQTSISGVISDKSTNNPLDLVVVSAFEGKFNTLSDGKGRFQLEIVRQDVPSEFEAQASIPVTFQLLGYSTVTIDLVVGAKDIRIDLTEQNFELSTATVVDKSRGELAQVTLRDVDGVAIYAGRKNELILPNKLDANLATNNAREIFKGVAGLTVWENDGAGLQLSIGARGLDPNRTSNFNTRQNGFDISADALGYPESYYTPPAQALQRIELVRGAASLQYGTQFGGLLNFKLKEGVADRKLQVVSEQTAGSFGLFNSFNSVGGTIGKINYYAFGQFKRGDGWRDNSGFEQSTGYLDVHYQLSPKLRIGIELTKMQYLAQQPGGLLDFEFDQTPRVSKRSRNWFRVNWGLAALHLDYDFSDRTKLNVRTFVLDAQRDALGELGPINRPDPMRERDLIEGKYRNFGQEIRLLHRYDIAGKPATLIVGTRFYSGLTQTRQGLASDGSNADFTFNNPERLESSDFDFPSRNYAAFAEHLVNLGKGWSVTPGVRVEHIRTASDGYYRRLVSAGNEIILDTITESNNSNPRSFVIAGLGLSHRSKKGLEVYANASQNFRSINFSDLVVVNPNLIIDSTLTDERGYNIELGFRGSSPNGIWNFDASAFFLRYANRIGLREILLPDPIQVERLVSLRTNIGAANVYGIEAFGEVDLAAWLKPEAKDWSVKPFLNVSLINGKYRTGGPAVVGRNVELIPPVSLKTGVAAGYKNLRGQFLFTHVTEHFSDATNATLVADATRGLIPTYTVADFTMSYTFGKFRAQVGANNLFDARYFTRRAQGYPGPGIIPSEGRSIYGGLRVTL
ncbi:MAG: TonB-dependent receptor [Saprospiraceae bacterium]